MIRENPIGFIGLVLIVALVPFANKGVMLDSIDIVFIASTAASAAMIMNPNLHNKTHVLFGALVGIEALIASKITA